MLGAVTDEGCDNVEQHLTWNNDCLLFGRRVRRSRSGECKNVYRIVAKVLD
jgi:hypothetical protein